MLPRHYFEVICCPTCRGDLSELDDRLSCSGCSATYPIVDGIPVLVAGSTDEVSRSVGEFYASAWKESEAGVLTAQVVHEPTAVRARWYCGNSEAKFVEVFRTPGEYFLDAGCGAQPRIEFGKTHRYHICLDFSLDGLRECRRRLGSRVIAVCGSLLKIPLKDGICASVLASHCLYHIDKDRQNTAIEGLLRVLRRDGCMLIFYGNPDYALQRSLLFRASRKLWRQGRALAADAPEGSIYFHLHGMDWMIGQLSVNSHRVTARSVRLLPDSEAQEAFSGSFGGAWFALFKLFEKLFPERPRWAYFIAYVVEGRG